MTESELYRPKQCSFKHYRCISKASSKMIHLIIWLTVYYQHAVTVHFRISSWETREGLGAERWKVQKTSLSAHHQAETFIARIANPRLRSQRPMGAKSALAERHSSFFIPHFSFLIFHSSFLNKTWNASCTSCWMKTYTICKITPKNTPKSHIKHKIMQNNANIKVTKTGQTKQILLLCSIMCYPWKKKTK